MYALSAFAVLSPRLKGSTVNMNIMGWVYSRVAGLVGYHGHTALGLSLMIGKYETRLLYLGVSALLKEKT